MGVGDKGGEGLRVQFDAGTVSEEAPCGDVIEQVPARKQKAKVASKIDSDWQERQRTAGVLQTRLGFFLRSLEFAWTFRAIETEKQANRRP